MPRMRRLAAAVATIVALAAATVVLGAVSAFAHADPTAVSPGSGAVLNTPPTQVAMVTAEPMALVAGDNDLVVTGPGGVVSQNPATIDSSQSHISVRLQSNLATGTYTVAWHTVSGADGDAASGTWSFVYDPSKPASPGSSAPPAAAPATPAAPAATAPAATVVASPARGATTAAPAAPATGSGGEGQTRSPLTARELFVLGGAAITMGAVVGSLALRRRHRPTQGS